ncbi:MAG: 16S rRNA (guanine(527)-N(7))-methyltransferase RsmG [Syntrophomonas sp.]|jgi:16S rRNA (guanine527-N7)-methyltransferase
MEIYVKKYLQLVLEENKKQNLVSRKTTLEDLEQHIQDSVQVLEWVSLAGQAAIDIGSGAGFPGLVLAMFQPDCRMTLVESDLKKSTFLQNVKKELGLDNVRIIRTRVELLGQDIEHRAGYDLCTCRAVAAMRVILEYGLPLVKPGGRVLLWKGSSYQQEIAEAQTALQVLGGKIDGVYQYNLMHDKDRTIVAVRKVHPTPAQFPRKVGAPTKKPL